MVETWLENLETPVAIESHEIVFECGDGYSPTRPLSAALEAHGYIAFADTNAPDGQLWTPKKKFNGQDLVMAPFYLVWNDETKKKAASRPWPHNLLRLKIVPSAKRYASLAPRNKNHTEGFQLFKKHCIVCHALDGTGGTMGPELHSPRNVTTYWKKDQLIPFIRNPASFRKQAKMPSMAHIGDVGIAKIIAYLENLTAE